MSKEAIERLRLADDLRWRAAGLRGNGHPQGEQLVREANTLRCCAELFWLSTTGDREAAALFSTRGCA